MMGDVERIGHNRLQLTFTPIRDCGDGLSIEIPCLSQDAERSGIEVRFSSWSPEGIFAA